jgi:hypothetical protein
VRNTYTHITIWVDLARDISLKQVFFTPSGDTDTTIYSNIRPEPADRPEGVCHQVQGQVQLGNCCSSRCFERAGL